MRTGDVAGKGAARGHAGEMETSEEERKRRKEREREREGGGEGSDGEEKGMRRG